MSELLYNKFKRQFLHYFRGSCFGCFVSQVDKAHTDR